MRHMIVWIIACLFLPNLALAQNEAPPLILPNTLVVRVSTNALGDVDDLRIYPMNIESVITNQDIAYAAVERTVLTQPIIIHPRITNGLVLPVPVASSYAHTGQWWGDFVWLLPDFGFYAYGAYPVTGGYYPRVDFLNPQAYYTGDGYPPVFGVWYQQQALDYVPTTYWYRINNLLYYFYQLPFVAVARG